MVHTIAQNVELCLAKSRQCDGDFVGSTNGANRGSVDGKHDVSRMERVGGPIGHLENKQTALAPSAEIRRELGTNGNHPQTADVERSGS